MRYKFLLNEATSSGSASTGTVTFFSIAQDTLLISNKGSPLHLAIFFYENMAFYPLLPFKIFDEFIVVLRKFRQDKFHEGHLLWCQKTLVKIVKSQFFY